MREKQERPDAAVRKYLRKVGGAEVAQIARGLNGRWSESAVRAALKRVGAYARGFGGWSSTTLQDGAWRYGGKLQTWQQGDRIIYPAPKPFELWRLEPWKSTSVKGLPALAFAEAA